MPDVVELWKQFEHVRPHECGNVFGKTTTVVFAATEQQAMISGRAEIIHHKARVMNAKSVRYQLARSLLAQ